MFKIDNMVCATFDSFLFQKLLKDFYSVSSLSSSIIDLNGNTLVYAGYDFFCKKFGCENTNDINVCISKLIDISGENGANQCVSSVCRHGIATLIVPVCVNGLPLAYLTLGQFFFNAPEKKILINQAVEFGFDKNEYVVTLESIPVCSELAAEKAALFLKNQIEAHWDKLLDSRRIEKCNVELKKQIKKTEQKLAQLQFECDVLFENSAAAVVIVKGQRVVDRVNDRLEEISGYSREEMIGRNTEDWYESPEAFREFGRIAEPILKAGKVVEREYKFFHKNGDARWCFIYGKALYPPVLEKGVLWVLEDINDRIELEQVKEDVGNIMRHDIKVPLNSIIGLSDLLLNDQSLNGDQRKDILEIKNSGKHICGHIDRSLLFCKVKGGEYEYCPCDTDCVQVILKVLREPKIKAQNRKLQFKFSLDGIEVSDYAECVIKADPSLFHAMISNLVNNAVEAAPMQSAIRISISNMHEYIEVSVKNKGGVPQDIRSRFFDKYVTSGKKGGVGLGTYAARLMARVQGGDIGLVCGEDETEVVVWMPVNAV